MSKPKNPWENPWEKWEGKNMVAVDILARELAKLIRKLPDGAQLPDSVADLFSELKFLADRI